MAKFSSDGWSPGDIVTFEGKYAVNPFTGEKLKYLQQFLVVCRPDGELELIPDPNSEMFREESS